MKAKPSDGELRLRIYDYFVGRGRPPMPAELAADLGIPSVEIEDAYRRLADAHVIVLAPGTPYIWLANPLSALPSPYSVQTRDGHWWGVCIWDAMGILAMLDSDGVISALCPDCSEPLRLEVRDGEIAGPGVVHYAVPAAHWWDDIGFN